MILESKSFCLSLNKILKPIYWLPKQLVIQLTMDNYFKNCGFHIKQNESEISHVSLSPSRSLRRTSRLSSGSGCPSCGIQSAGIWSSLLETRMGKVRPRTELSWWERGLNPPGPLSWGCEDRKNKLFPFFALPWKLIQSLTEYQVKAIFIVNFSTY